MKRLKFILLAAVAISAISCGSNEGKIKLISETNFDKEIDGKKVSLYTLKNKNGMVVQVTNYGTRIVSVWVPDKEGQFRDVVLGRNTIDEYLSSDEKFYGATVGRYANRIANGKFTLDGKEYQLDLNDGKNHLHGGSKGLYHVVWDAEPYTTTRMEDAILFKYHSPAGENGYPGNVDITIRMLLAETNEIRIYYEATTDSATIINLSHHSYFNLNGEGDETIEDHMLKLNASNFTPTDSTLIPTGEIVPVAGTPLDFMEMHRIGERINDDYEALKLGGGYDHNWVLETSGSVTAAAEIYSPKTGIYMAVLTDAPGIQFYSGNFIKGIDIGKSGKPYKYRSAFCLETQNFPDSPNHPNFPSAVLNPGETYKSLCYYYFGLKE